MDLVPSDEPSSDTFNFQFLKVCSSSEASCSARKRSPLSVQSRIVTEEERSRRANVATVSLGKGAALACFDAPLIPRQPYPLRLQFQKSTVSAAKFRLHVVQNLTSFRHNSGERNKACTTTAGASEDEFCPPANLRHANANAMVLGFQTMRLRKLMRCNPVPRPTQLSYSVLKDLSSLTRQAALPRWLCSGPATPALAIWQASSHAAWPPFTMSAWHCCSTARHVASARGPYR